MKVKGVILTANEMISTEYEIGDAPCPWCNALVQNSIEGESICDWCFENVWANLNTESKHKDEFPIMLNRIPR